jgi:hypothetical protein
MVRRTGGRLGTGENIMVMLRIRIDGREVETTPALLARLVFEGRADRDSAVRVPGETAEQPLEQCLGSLHCEALAGELHRRLERIGSMDSAAVDLHELRVQVERLCRWQWPDSSVTARFFWSAAWLNELAERPRNALAFYDAFLQRAAGENHLRLLAWNNRGVLQIRLGQLEGVRDLARAALGEEGQKGGRSEPQSVLRPSPVLTFSPSSSHSPSDLSTCSSSPLPVACLNLLNLINVAFGTADLLRVVDEELADFFAQRPPAVQRFWLEPPSSGSSLVTRDTGHESRDTGPTPADRPLPILRDPTYQRLNCLVTRLAAHARPLADDLYRPMDRAASAFQQLCLWKGTPTQDFALGPKGRCAAGGTPNGRPDGGSSGRPTEDRSLASSSGPFVRGQYHRYAEAMTLLLSEDIPSALARREDPLDRLEQSAREELAAIDQHVACGQYDLARSRLQVQRTILVSADHRQTAAMLLAQVDARLERVAGLEVQEQRLGLQRTCAEFVSEVQKFCSLAEVRHAQSLYPDLSGRLQRFKTELPPWMGHEARRLLDDLAARVQRHWHDLRRREIETRIADSLQHLRQNRPSDRATPVPKSVYGAVAQCRLHDPEGWVEDWAALEEQLDAHQAQHHIYRALTLLGAYPVPWERVQDDLIQALTYQPDQWLTVAPLFGLPVVNPPIVPEDNKVITREGSGDLPSTHFRTFSPSDLGGPGRLLERTLQQIGANANKCLRLWQCVEMTLSPVAAARNAEALAQARSLAESYLDHWPAGLPQGPGPADPRHPVSRFLETCEKAHCLIQAEQELSARPSRPKQAKRHLAAVCRLGLETRDQLRRVATGLYLAQFQEDDAPPTRRQMLAALDAWVDTVPLEAMPRMQEQEIVEEIRNVRTTVGRPAAVAPQV